MTESFAMLRISYDLKDAIIHYFKSYGRLTHDVTELKVAVRMADHMSLGHFVLLQEKTSTIPQT